jgi:ethylene-insensitive protein 2
LYWVVGFCCGRHALTVIQFLLASLLILYFMQGVLEPAFSKPRKPLTGCACLQIVGPVARPISGTFTTSAVILETIKDVEQAISGRKGRSGTAAGDVAFPKGKENLASVLKRYKRRLSSKPSGGQ